MTFLKSNESLFIYLFVKLMPNFHWCSRNLENAPLVLVRLWTSDNRGVQRESKQTLLTKKLRGRCHKAFLLPVMVGGNMPYLYKTHTGWCQGVDSDSILLLQFLPKLNMSILGLKVIWNKCYILLSVCSAPGIKGKGEYYFCRT